ncbi:hypothetical protein SAMN04488543_1614 [Friedmanniella luteola]|uniref:Uncharacterized protein n=1 Tax=Friedmanniella luteola TaxID=546871 RepID=A0A1H1RPJ1_9ACTN|nr:hypothetical protein SAMN04488543_1614 [Friedmanniella luteola]
MDRRRTGTQRSRHRLAPSGAWSRSGSSRQQPRARGGAHRPVRSASPQMCGLGDVRRPADILEGGPDRGPLARRGADGCRTRQPVTAVCGACRVRTSFGPGELRSRWRAGHQCGDEGRHRPAHPRGRTRRPGTSCSGTWRRPGGRCCALPGSTPRARRSSTSSPDGPAPSRSRARGGADGPLVGVTRLVRELHDLTERSRGGAGPVTGPQQRAGRPPTRTPGRSTSTRRCVRRSRLSTAAARPGEIGQGRRRGQLALTPALA